MRLITADLRPVRKVSPALAWLAGGMTVVACVTTWMAHDAEVEVANLQARIAEQARQEVQARARGSAAHEPEPYERSAREMLAEYRRPWPEALTALETTEVAGVTLNALETPSGDALMRLEVDAPDHAVLLDYLAALNAGRSGTSRELVWRLVSTRKTDKAGQVAATILCEVVDGGGQEAR